MNREENVLGNDFSTGGLLVFALPTMVMMVFLGLYTMVDTVFVSRFVSTDALGAINIVTPVINLVVGLGTMLAAGGNAIISRTMGEGDCVFYDAGFLRRGGRDGAGGAGLCDDR